MKTLMSILFLATPLVVLAQSTQQSPLTLALRSTPTTATAGAEILLTLNLANTSGTDIIIGRSVGGKEAEFNFLIEVHDIAGKPVAVTQHHRRLRGEIPVTSSNQQIRLQPGQSISETAILNQLYEVSRPGKYVIQAKRDIPAELGGAVMKSNALTITGTP